MMPHFPVHGAGLGLRRPYLAAFGEAPPVGVDFLEIAPENWLDADARQRRALAHIAERVPLVCHGLLLNLGGVDPLDLAFLRRLKPFLDRHNVRCYGDHLSFCGEAGLLYELLPMPFTTEAVAHLARRIRVVQDLLERRIAVENPSYYCTLANDLTESEFLNAVLVQADCDLLLDLNNLYVNSCNHRYEAGDFLRSLPAKRIAYGHVAGHQRAADGLLIDTHGAAVSRAVWQLLRQAYAHFGVFPTLLERDENLPALGELLVEIEQLRVIQRGLVTPD
ncbi:MAG: DUF692 domain-containing protein [Gammaproteobacteria bacterium]|nr:DUF692 domain-containing protein [Gammaproteobacteria bacterium]